ncbi:MAG: hypothetical protein CMM96_00935 [Rickettsiales bacterium]|nr:hypothetical protein [Rickettsiales bacterium]
MATTDSKNSFASAARTAATLTQGENGANKYTTSDNSAVDFFTGVLQEITPEAFDTLFGSLMAGIKQCSTAEQKAQYVTDIFRLMAHKREPSRDKTDGGEGIKNYPRIMFLRLYDTYPQTCIDLVKSGFFAHYGYWKDLLVIWAMVNETGTLTKRQRFDHYNPLILAIRETYLKARTEDLRTLMDFVAPKKLQDYDKDAFTRFIDQQMETGELPDLCPVGKWCVREDSEYDKRSYWYIVDETNGRLIKQSHICFMTRATLKRRNGAGVLVDFPATSSVPYKVRRMWRQCNSKLNIAAHVVENIMCGKDWHRVIPGKLTSINHRNYAKAILNEKVKGHVDPCYDETGNRHPHDEVRIACRKRYIAHMMSGGKFNVSQLNPNEIVEKAQNSKSTVQKMQAQHMWDKKVENVMEKLEAFRQKLAEDATLAGKIDQARRAIASGKVLACADISGSMTTTASGAAPNRPIDHAVSLAAMLSQVAHPDLRGLVMTFSESPHIYDLPVDMPIIDKIQKIHSQGGLNTNYKKMHESIIKMCQERKVDPPGVLAIFSDGEFDSFDPALYSYSWESRNKKSTSYTTLHEKITAMYVRAGLQEPITVFWNLNYNGTAGVQTKASHPNVMFLQGKSPALFKFLLYGESCDQEEREVVVDGKVVKTMASTVTPEMVFRKCMDDHERFLPLLRVLHDSTEGDLRHFIITEDMV